MKTYIIAFVLSILATVSTAHAATITIDTTRLTKEQISQKVEELAASQTTNSAASLDATNIANWKAVGEEAGKAIVAFASQIGVAATEFATSEAGILVIIVGSLYFFGHTVAFYVIGIVLCIVATRTVNRVFRTREDVLVSETTNKDGSVTKKFKSRYTHRLTLLSTREFTHDESTGTTYFVYLGSLLVLNLPGILFIVNA
jgi:hypothetical protein